MMITLAIMIMERIMNMKIILDTFMDMKMTMTMMNMMSMNGRIMTTNTMTMKIIIMKDMIMKERIMIMKE